ncbi:outer membrane beta-barrel protein [Novosphingobium sp. FSY-8]|uniref:Outer membrane beta-barrel protein n=1 Tax=Novosphingobium ovatum TaxID=1908523 RepID=A0ABW9XE24_9SPHN|nr:outer membrane beta-barrel protein [Novosphingobium ovatum]NBC36790.1 outer membrane beta-barrel protein [Novosphingobium ovatum]
MPISLKSRPAAMVLAASAMLAASPALAGGAPRIDYDNLDMQFYAGPVVGYDNVTASHPLIGSDSRSGITYGGVVGVDTRVTSKMRVGFETEITGASTSLSLFDGTDTYKVGVGRDIFVGLKMGYAVTPTLLTYVKAGYSNVLGTYDEYNATGARTYHASQQLGGVRAAVGTEYLVNKVRLRLEYRYSNYGELNINGVNTGVTFERHQVMMGALYGF